MSTDPKAGDAIRGTDVRLVVSKGPERFRVDTALVGKAVGRRRAAAAGDPAGDPVHDDRDVTTTTCPRVRWSASTRPAGTDLMRDQVVTVVVSKGHEPVAVPDVTGQSPEQAVANLEALGFKVQKGDDGRSATVDVGEVMAVSPGPGDGPVALRQHRDDQRLGRSSRW